MKEGQLPCQHCGTGLALVHLQPTGQLLEAGCAASAGCGDRGGSTRGPAEAEAFWAAERQVQVLNAECASIVVV